MSLAVLYIMQLLLKRQTKDEWAGRLCDNIRCHVIMSLVFMGLFGMCITESSEQTSVSVNEQNPSILEQALLDHTMYFP